MPSPASSANSVPIYGVCAVSPILAEIAMPPTVSVLAKHAAGKTKVSTLREMVATSLALGRPRGFKLETGPAASNV